MTAGVRGVLLASVAALLACGVKAPPRPPEKPGSAAARPAPDGGATGGEAAPADGGEGRP